MFWAQILQLRGTQISSPISQITLTSSQVAKFGGNQSREVREDHALKTKKKTTAAKHNTYDVPVRGRRHNYN